MANIMWPEFKMVFRP